MSKNIVGLARQSPRIEIGTPFDTSSLEGKTILITGGASGFGAGFAKRWAESGATIIIGDIDSTQGKALVDELRKETSNASHQFLYCDVTIWQSQVDFFRKAVELSPNGRLDQVVANAGIEEAGTKLNEPQNLDQEEPPEPQFKTVDVNLKGVLYTTHLALFWLPRNPSTSPDFKPDRHLLLIGSVASLIPFAGHIQYSIAKHGVLGIFRSLRATAFQHGVRVNLLLPYFMDTPMIHPVGRAFLAGIGMGKHEDVVEAATRFAADTSIRGRALAVGPRVKLDDNGNLLPPDAQQAKEISSFEVYAHDFEEVEAFTLRYVKILNAVEAGRGYIGWAGDIVKAICSPFVSWFKS
ncbi:short chain dehydrogenase/reductase-like protein [Hyaloscypha variabilis F]|uniref:Short chain dehydrogenase/reductase-like protein n=1 Tax=Hyaloscypha variabilis (strain UAMH 11265 / GT02V1 / F) TaxID=1149755 RepID=A0A2J6R147_HYAVF|nr:short chain dehydrogenase/reductase-like protein [Hyaloscypha variabilis F]